MQHPLKAAIKRGALIAAANWPVAIIQATGDSLFKVLLAAPILGGVFLVALAVGGDPSTLITLEWRQMAATIASSLWSQPVVLATFLIALAVVGAGGALVVFMLKGGTVWILVQSDRDAGPIEDYPLHVDVLARTSRFSIERYLDAAHALFPRFARLGGMLMAFYVAAGLGYMLIVTSLRADGWSATALITAAFVGLTTLVNLLYLLVQIVVAADDCSVAAAMRRVAAFLGRSWRPVSRVFLLVLALGVGATGASLLAMAALSLVAFVPFVGLAAFPLQLLAWLLRGLVFQYLGLTALGAYLKLYRTFVEETRGRLQLAF